MSLNCPKAAAVATTPSQPRLPSSSLPLSVSFLTQKVCEPGPSEPYLVCHLAAALFFFFFWILVSCMEFFLLHGLELGLP